MKMRIICIHRGTCGDPPRSRAEPRRWLRRGRRAQWRPGFFGHRDRNQELAVPIGGLGNFRRHGAPDAVILFIGGGFEDFLDATVLEQFLIAGEILEGFGVGHHLVNHFVKEILGFQRFLAALYGANTADALHRLIDQIVVAFEAAENGKIVDQLRSSGYWRSKWPIRRAHQA